ncbi:MAG: hypothetical protein KI791_02200 [Cyclobacteriaceae bacterium]|nr:hypothetical protein [Cyclobacteriaceae bacterium SS2]
MIDSILQTTSGLNRKSPSDIYLTSIDTEGTLGSLNKLVLNSLDYEISDLPTKSELNKGWSYIQSSGKKSILFIVTLSEEKTSDNLRINLFNALSAIQRQISSKILWVPLLGTGAGSLNYSESLRIILDVLNSLNLSLFKPRKIYISFPSSLKENNKQILENKIQTWIRHESEKSGNRNYKTIPTDLKTESVKGKPENELKSRAYFVGGHHWNKTENQFDRFIRDGIWENGHENKFHSGVKSVQPKDIIFLKSTWSSAGKGILSLNGVGVVIKNHNDGFRLDVNWHPFTERIDLSTGSQYRGAFHRIKDKYLSGIIEGIKLKIPDIDAIINDLSTLDFKEQIHSENSIDNIPFHLDQIEIDDRLNREAIAKSLSRLLNKNIFNQNNKVDKSFMVHLQGSWGEGKSTFLNLLTKNLDQEGNQWVVVEFNAWQNQHISPPWWIFLDSMYRQVFPKMFDKYKERFRIREWFRRFFWYKSTARATSIILVTISTILLLYLLPSLLGLFDDQKSLLNNSNDIKTITETIISIGSVIGLIYGLWKFISSPFMLSNSHSAKAFLEHAIDPMKKVKKHFEALVTNVNNSGKMMAIYIDDLDRCSSGFTVELLEGIQTLFSEKKVLYVVAGDRKWISTCFENHYKDYSDIVKEPGQKLGYLFIEKAFQLSIRLPKLSGQVKKSYWDFIINIQKSENLGLVTNQDFKISQSQRSEVKAKIKEETAKRNYNNLSHLDRIQKDFKLSETEFNDIALEAYDEDSEEIKHILQDHYELIDANPRGIKRLANQYNMYRNILIAEGKRSFDINKLFRWLMIQNKYPLFADWIERNIDLLDEDFLMRDDNPEFRIYLKRDTFLDNLLFDNENKYEGKLGIEDVRQFIGY